MKKYFTPLNVILILILLTGIGFGFYNYQRERKHFDVLKKMVNNDAFNRNFKKLYVKENDSTIKPVQKDYYDLQKDIIEIKNKQLLINEELDRKYTDWLARWANFWTIIGLSLGAIAVFFSYKQLVKEKVVDEISALTNIEKQFINRNLEEYKKHINLKNKAKIVVLNEKGTEFPEGFKKVLQLYKGYDEAKDRIDIGGLKDAVKDDIINRLKEADVVIIENQVSDKKWNIKTVPIYKIDDSGKIIKIDSATEKANTIAAKNSKILAEIANKICDTTAIIYYGLANDGYFPANKVGEDKQHFVTFANAPAQLYGNLLNMLKFKNELEHA